MLVVKVQQIKISDSPLPKTLTFTLTFQGHDLVKLHFGTYVSFCWAKGHQSLTNGSLDEGLKEIKTYLERFVGETQADEFRLPPFHRKYVFDHNFRSTTHRMMIVESRSYVFKGRGIRWCHLFQPITLTFEGHYL